MKCWCDESKFSTIAPRRHKNPLEPPACFAICHKPHLSVFKRGRSACDTNCKEAVVGWRRWVSWLPCYESALNKDKSAQRSGNQNIFLWCLGIECRALFLKNKGRKERYLFKSLPGGEPSIRKICKQRCQHDWMKSLAGMVQIQCWVGQRV